MFIVKRNYNPYYGTHYNICNQHNQVVHREWGLRISNYLCQCLNNGLSINEGKIQYKHKYRIKLILKSLPSDLYKNKLKRKYPYLRQLDNSHHFLLELHQLIEYFRDFNFQYSSELSNYIKKNNLSYVYQNITGNLEMHNDDRSWLLEGGLAPKIYRIVCNELKLSNHESGARPGNYTPNAYL